MPASKHEIFQAQTLGQLQFLARKYGYSFGWADKIHQARKAKHDRVYRSRAPGKEVVRQAQDQIPQDERLGERRLAGQAYMHPDNTILD